MAKKFPEEGISLNTSSGGSYAQDVQHGRTEMDETGGAYVATLDNSGQPLEHTHEFYSKPPIFGAC